MIIANERLNLEVDIVRIAGCFMGCLEVYEISSG